MRLRLLWGGAAVVALVAVLALDRHLAGRAFAALALGAVLWALEELFPLLPALRRRERWLARGGAAAVLLAAGWRPEWLLVVLGLWVGAGALLVLTRPWTQAVTDLGLLSFVLLYLGVLPATLVMVRQEPCGWGWVVLTLLVAKTGDSGAYFAGRWLGRRRLAPRLSPAKTWAGLWGGLLTGALAGAAAGPLLLEQKVSALGGGGFGLAVAAVGAGGDLFESLLKRQGGRKDSGQIPGVGGILDLMDSVLFAGPVALGAALWVGR